MRIRFQRVLAAALVLAGLRGAARAQEVPAEPEVLTLERAVRLALERNLEVKMAEAAVSAARAGKWTATAERLPRLETGYSMARLSDDPEAIFGQNPPFIVGSKPNYRFRVGFSQPLFTGFALVTAEELAALGVDTATLQKQETEEAVILQTKEAYFLHLLSGHLRDVAGEAVERLASHLRDAEALYAEGVIPRNDLLKSRVRLAAARQELVRARNREAVSRSRLNLILRQEMDRELRLQDILTWTPSAPDLDKVLARGRARRPEVRALEVAVDRAAAAARMAKSGYYPDLLLVGEYTRQGDTFAVNGNGYTNTKNASVGLEARWTFFEWGKTRAEVSRALLEKQRAVDALERARDQVALEIQQAYLDMATAAANIRTARAAREQARENYRITELRYREGITTSTEVLDAETLLAQAEADYYGALYGYALAQAALDRAAGGGREWVAGPPREGGEQDPAGGE